MSVSRRTLLKGAGALGAASAIPFAGSSKIPLLALYDGRLPEARAFAATARRRGLRAIDVAAPGASVWHIARQELDRPGAIIGLTGWSDWVILRGLMEEQGKRLRHETRIAHAAPRIATPFAWEMA
jgi:hypothetical protein